MGNKGEKALVLMAFTLLFSTQTTNRQMSRKTDLSCEGNKEGAVLRNKNEVLS